MEKIRQHDLKKKKGLNKNALILRASMLVVSSFILQILSFVFRISITRFAGTQALAIFQLVMSGYNIVMAFCLQGAVLAASRFSAQKLECSGVCEYNFSAINFIKKNTLKIFLVLFFIITIPALLFRNEVSEFLLGDKRTLMGFSIIFLCILLTGFENLNKGIFIGTKKVFPTIVSEIVELLIRIVVVVFLLWLTRNQSDGISAAVIVVGMIISECWSVLYLKFKYRRTFNKERKNEEYHDGVLQKDILKTSVFVSLEGFLNKIIINANTILIPQMLMLGGAGRENAMSDFAILFSMTMPLVILPSAIIGPVATVVMPQISQDCVDVKKTSHIKQGKMSRGSADIADIRRKTAKLFQLVGLCAIPSMCGLFFFAKPLSICLYDNELGASFAFVLALSMVFEYYQIAAATVLNGLGHPNIAQASVVTEGIIQLLCTIILVPSMQITGYVIGNIISTLVGALINLVAVMHFTKIKFRFANWVLRPLLASCISAVSANILFVSLLNTMSMGIALTLALIAFVVIFIVIIKLLGTDLFKYLKETLIKSGEQN